MISAPLSHVIPYLAWNPVFLLIVGALLLDEKPTIWVKIAIWKIE